MSFLQHGKGIVALEFKCSTNVSMSLYSIHLQIGHIAVCKRNQVNQSCPVSLIIDLLLQHKLFDDNMTTLE